MTALPKTVARWDYNGDHMAQIEDGDYVRYDDYAQQAINGQTVIAQQQAIRDLEGEIALAQGRLAIRNEQIDGYERQLGIINAGAERTIGSEIERLMTLEKVADDLMRERRAHQAPTPPSSKEMTDRDMLRSCLAAMRHSHYEMGGHTDWSLMIDSIEKHLAGSAAETTRESEFVSIGWQYKFPSSWGGDVWLDSSSQYNGHNYTESREIFARRAEKAPECQTCNDTGEIDELLGGIARSNPHAPCPDCRPTSAQKTGAKP